MTRSDCYKLLGLKPGADEATIKRHYKKLALRIHPDINPDPKAHEQFILLTKAMELLLTPEPDSATERQSRKAKPDETAAERTQRMEEARKRFEQQQKRKSQENTTYFNLLTTGKRWKLFKTLVIACWIFALALFLDLLLPTHFEKDTLLSYSHDTHNGILFERIAAVELDKTGAYFMKNAPGFWIDVYPEVEVETTWLLHTPITMYTTDDFSVFKTGFDFHIGAIRWPLIALMLIPLFTYLRPRKSLWFVFFYHLSLWGCGTLLVFLLLTQGRLEHLLTFGLV